MSERPNILWICTDQQRADTLGSAGNRWTTTPHLDALAARGTVFEAAYAQSPVCTPSRASFLTGRYPRTNRTRQNGQSIPGDEVLVTKRLADAGYVNGLAGKLHLSAAHPSVAPGGEPRTDDGYAEFHWSHHPSPEWPTNEYDHWLRAQGEEFRTPPLPDTDLVRTGMPEALHQTTWCADRAIDFIEANAGFASPWLFSVNVYDPHHPFDPPEAYLAPYLERLDEIPLPDFVPGELADKPVFQRVDHEGAHAGREPFAPPRMTDREHRLVRAAYWAMCDLIDVQVGRMLATLDRTGQRERTIVVFTTDHGEMLGDHGLYLKGPYFYEQAVHVPLLVAGPGVVPQRVADLVELVDLAPTLLETAGEPVPVAMQGRSLWPVLTGGEADARQDVYCEYANAMPWHRDPTPHATMVRTATQKLVAFHGLGVGELYDLVEDPGEHRNLWDSPEHAAVKAAMLERLADRIAWTTDPLPERVAPF